MDIINRRPGLAALVAFIAGLIIGLVVLGWWLFPVRYTGADPSGTFPEYQAIIVRNAADLYAFDNNQEKLRASLSGWGGDTVACDLAAASTDLADQQRLEWFPARPPPPPARPRRLCPARRLTRRARAHCRCC